MKDEKTFKLISISLVLLFLLSACSLLNNQGIQATSTITMDIQSSPDQNATDFLVSTSTSHEPTLLPTYTPSNTVTLLATATPTETLTPTATTVPPAVLSWKTYSYSCEFASGGTTMTMVLEWTDSSNSEVGFRVYRNNIAITTLEPNSTTYTDVTFIPSGGNVSYFVEIFNQSWQVRTSTITYACQ